MAVGYTGTFDFATLTGVQPARTNLHLAASPPPLRFSTITFFLYLSLLGRRIPHYGLVNVFFPLLSLRCIVVVVVVTRTHLHLPSPRPLFYRWNGSVGSTSGVWRHLVNSSEHSFSIKTSVFLRKSSSEQDLKLNTPGARASNRPPGILLRAPPLSPSSPYSRGLSFRPEGVPRDNLQQDRHHAQHL